MNITMSGTAPITYPAIVGPGSRFPSDMKRVTPTAKSCLRPSDRVTRGQM